MEDNIGDIEKISEKGLRKALNKLRKTKKRTKIILGIVLIVVLVAGYFIFKPKAQTYEWDTVKKGDVVKEVSANGTVEATSEIDLKFKSSGTIDKIFNKVGNKVKKGAILVQLDTGEVYSQYLQAQASYNQAKAKLDQLLAGASQEKIAVYEQVVENAEVSLADARAKADNDLNQDYNSALVYLIDASSKANKALADLKDMEKVYFYHSTSLETTFRSKRAEAEDAFYGTATTDGAEDLVAKAVDDSSQENINTALLMMKTALQKVIAALDYTKSAMADATVRENVSSTDRTTIDTDISYNNTAYSNINTAQKDIADQKITNQTNINSAENILKKAEADLNEIKAPSREVDIAIFRTDVEKYKASVTEYSQKLADASIIAPFDGEIAKIDGKIGETVTADGKVIITLLSPNGFEIKADVPETDIGNIAQNNPATIVLDAFPETTYQGQILEINPAETVIEGVVYYQLKVLFTEPNNNLRSGMSGDVTIQVAKKENVLSVPQRAVITKNGDKIVRILVDEKIQEVKVVTGIKGSKGEIEIISGLNEGEKIITFLKK